MNNAINILGNYFTLRVGFFINGGGHKSGNRSGQRNAITTEIKFNP